MQIDRSVIDKARKTIDGQSRADLSELIELSTELQGLAAADAALRTEATLTSAELDLLIAATSVVAKRAAGKAGRVQREPLLRAAVVRIAELKDLAPQEVHRVERLTEAAPFALQFRLVVDVVEEGEPVPGRGF